MTPQNRELSFTGDAVAIAERHDFELKGFLFECEKEQLRAERRVRVAVVQHAIVLPTTAAVADQRRAIHDRVGKMVEAAFHAGVKIICFQEAWSEFCLAPLAGMTHIHKQRCLLLSVRGSGCRGRSLQRAQSTGQPRLSAET